jgi:hypothetical protein
MSSSDVRSIFGRPGERGLDGVSIVQCPTCDFDHNHIVGVEVNAGGEVTRITKSGVTSGRGPVGARGVVIRTELTCENGGHPWALDFQFHKGQVEAMIDNDPWRDIWRD